MDREHGQRALDGDQRAQAGVDRLDLHAGQPVLDGGHPGAAVAVEVHTEDAEFAELRCEIVDRQGAGLEPVGDVGAQFAVAEVCDGVPDLPFLVGEQGVEADEVERCGCRGGFRHEDTVTLSW